MYACQTPPVTFQPFHSCLHRFCHLHALWPVYHVPRILITRACDGKPNTTAADGLFEIALPPHLSVIDGPRIVVVYSAPRAYFDLGILTASTPGRYPSCHNDDKVRKRGGYMYCSLGVPLAGRPSFDSKKWVYTAGNLCSGPASYSILKAPESCTLPTHCLNQPDAHAGHGIMPINGVSKSLGRGRDLIHTAVGDYRHPQKFLCSPFSLQRRSDAQGWDRV